MPLYKFDLYKHSRFFNETKRHGMVCFVLFYALLFCFVLFFPLCLINQGFQELSTTKHLMLV